jgi:hypothetical protein
MAELGVECEKEEKKEKDMPHKTWNTDDLLEPIVVIIIEVNARFNLNF